MTSPSMTECSDLGGHPCIDREEVVASLVTAFTRDPVLR